MNADIGLLLGHGPFGQGLAGRALGLKGYYSVVSSEWNIGVHRRFHEQFPDEVPELVERASLREALLIRVYQC